MQGTVVAVHSGGLYRVQCDAGPRSARPAERPDAPLPHQGRSGRSRDRRRLAVRSGPRHHHLPRTLKTHFEFPHNTIDPGRADADAAAAAARSGRASARLARARSAPHEHRPPAGASTIRRRSPFDTLGLESALLEGMRDLAASRRPRPIQSAVIPIALAGDDVIGCAETGTGKTAAFVLPILAAAAERASRRRPSTARTRVLILAPTRELAVQIEDDDPGLRLSHDDLPASPSTAASRWARRSARSGPASTSSSPRPAG